MDGRTKNIYDNQSFQQKLLLLIQSHENHPLLLSHSFIQLKQAQVNTECGCFAHDRSNSCVDATLLKAEVE
jgi:hypothetical protein